MAQIYGIPPKQAPASTQAATSMYYARKRRHARQEATAGKRGGLREQKATFGVTMRVRLTLA